VARRFFRCVAFEVVIARAARAATCSAAVTVAAMAFRTLRAAVSAADFAVALF